MLNKVKAIFYKPTITYKLGLLWTWFEAYNDSCRILDNLGDSNLRCGKTIAVMNVTSYHLYRVASSSVRIVKLRKYIKAHYSCLKTGECERIDRCLDKVKF